MGLGVPQALNVTVIVLQILFSFLMSESAVQEKAKSWQDRVLNGVTSTFFFAFMPLLGWRFSRGHLNLLAAAFWLGALLALYHLFQQKRVHWFHIFAFWLLTIHCILPSGAQIFAYALIFALPLFIVLTCQNWRASVCTVAIAVAAILSHFVFIYPSLQAYLHGDFARTVSDVQTVYSYLTEEWVDLLQSVFWFYPLAPTERHIFTWHEVFYSFGPITFLYLGHLATRRSWALLGTLTFCIFLALAMALHLHPVAEQLIDSFPFLGGFRVPARALLVVGFLIQVMSLIHITRTSIAQSSNVHLKACVATALVTTIICLVAPFSLLEGCAWALAIPLFVRIKKIPSSWQPAIAMSLSVLSLFAFRSTIWPPPTDILEIERQAKVFRAEIEKLDPLLTQPLVRVQAIAPPIWNNAVAVSSLATLNGYWFATPFFLKLSAALEGHEAAATQMSFDFNLKSPHFEIVRDLYNIGAVVQKDHDPNTIVRLPSQTGVWISKEILPYQSPQDLIQQMSTLNRRDVQWATPDVIRALVPISSNCRDLRITGLSQNGRAHIEFSLSGADICPITIALNYVSSVRVQAIDTLTQLTPYRANGSLIGFLSPGHDTRIRVSFDPRIPFWVWLVSAMGLGLVGWLARRVHS